MHFIFGVICGGTYEFVVSRARCECTFPGIYSISVLLGFSFNLCTAIHDEMSDEIMTRYSFQHGCLMMGGKGVD